LLESQQLKGAIMRDDQSELLCDLLDDLVDCENEHESIDVE